MLSDILAERSTCDEKSDGVPHPFVLLGDVQCPFMLLKPARALQCS